MCLKIRGISHEGLCLYKTFSLFLFFVNEILFSVWYDRRKSWLTHKVSAWPIVNIVTYEICTRNTIPHSSKYNMQIMISCVSTTKMWRSGIYCMLHKSLVNNILNSRIFDVCLQCCDGCKFFGQEEKEITEAVGSAGVCCLLLSLRHFHSLTVVVTTGTATFNCFSLLTLLHLLLIKYRYLMN